MHLVDKLLAYKCCRITVWIFRWVPMLFVAALVSWSYYTFVSELCFVLVKSVPQRVAYLVVLHLLLGLFLWSYFYAVFTTPAKPPHKYYIPSDVLEELCSADNDFDYRCILDRFARKRRLLLFNRAYGIGVRFCIKCTCLKPDRSHHCSACGHCVLKFDHHCPWVNNCVSYSNYKSFVLFLAYGFYLNVFGFFAILPYFISYVREGVTATANKHRLFSDSDVVGLLQVLFLFAVAVMFGLAMGCLLVYHLILIARNQSTVESLRAPHFMYGPDKLAYNLGVKRNFHQVFGSSWLLWLLPVFSSPGNGCDFPRKNGPRDENLIAEDASIAQGPTA